MILSAVPGARPIPRRRMVQYLDLGVYDLLAPRLPTQLHRKTSDGQLRFESAFRIRNDFGEWVTQAQGSTARLIQATDQRQLDLLYGYLEGQNLGGLVNFRLGRQFDNSALDFLAVDGAWLELRTPSLGGIHLVAQGLGGYQARLNNWMGYAAFEFQGTDPTTARRGWRTPVVGGSIRVDVGDRASMRVGIRRTASTQDDPTASLELGNRGSVSQLAGFSLDEKVAFVTSHVELVKRVAHLTANARYNLATSRADIIDVGLTWTAGQDAFARLSYLRTLPIFDLDSIFNVFDLRAFEDVRMQLTRKLNPKWELAARGEMRFDRSQNRDAAARVHPGAGGGARVRFMLPKLQVTADCDLIAVGGSARLGAFIDTDYWLLQDRLKVSARLLHVRASDTASQRRDEVNFYGQIGFDYKLWRRVFIRASVEEGVSTTISQSLRVLASLTWDFTMRTGAR